MKERNKDGPTARIIQLGREAPGGVIRWHEAKEEYVAFSAAARREERNLISARGRDRARVSLNFHSSLQKVLRRYFEKVEGTKGYYVLKESITGSDVDDLNELRLFHQLWGSDQYGRSAINLPEARKTVSMLRMSQVNA